MITTYKLVCLFGLACTIIMTLIPSASSIKCFECNSNIDKNCSLKIPPDYLIRDCARNPEGIAYEMCRKITQTIDFEVNGLKPDHRVIRSCAYERHQGDAKSKDCYQRSGFGGRQEVCSCQADLCNNSNNIKINFSILLASASLIFFFSKLVS
ncbi:uncharacterized protein LOC135844831 [Planococcus citri]|uniref:uncharacterized protein LOC135844831 n=1 Tax=Planococcus citri TaxID=170843 RepID=UPI0031F764AB